MIAEIHGRVLDFFRLHGERGDHHYHSDKYLGQHFGVEPSDLRAILEPIISDGQLESFQGPSRKERIPYFLWAFNRTVPGNTNYRLPQNDITKSP
ncbi:MAG TPA: hypothetical protein VJH04_01520 [archaeon]|nr:hypothetical protein [archaeon]